MMIAILLGLALASNGAASFRPVDYVAEDRPTYYANHFNKIKNLVEQHGSDDPLTTGEMIAKLKRDLAMMKKGWLSPSEDKYEVLGQIDARQVDEYHRIVERLSWLTTESEQTCEPLAIGDYIMAVLQTFGKDLVAFAKNKPAHDQKWHSFLQHYGRSMAEFCYKMSLQTELTQPRGEKVFDKIVSLGDVDDEQTLLRRASELDFLRGKFDGWRMLKKVENAKKNGDNELDSAFHKPSSRFQSFLLQACRSVMRDFNEYFSPYNLALVFDEAGTQTPPIRYLKLNEYVRICRGVMMWDTQKELSENIKRNMPISSLVGKAVKCATCGG